jgi:hypothetical protein
MFKLFKCMNLHNVFRSAASVKNALSGGHKKPARETGPGFSVLEAKDLDLNCSYRPSGKDHLLACDIM